MDTPGGANGVAVSGDYAYVASWDSLQVIDVAELNAYDVLCNEWLIFTKDVLPVGTPVSDDSTEGDDPDPDGDGPGNDNTATSVEFVEAPVLGAALQRVAGRAAGAPRSACPDAAAARRPRRRSPRARANTGT